MNLMVYFLGLEASNRYFYVLHFLFEHFMSIFTMSNFFFAPLTINTIRWPLWFRQLVRFRIIPWCEWYLMFRFPFSIPLVSSNHWGRHDMVDLRAFWFVGYSIFWFFLLWDSIRVSLRLKISMGKQVSISLGLKINMWKQASSWIYILDRHKTLFHIAVWVNNRRLQINDKLGIIFIIKGPLGRQNRASIHLPFESFNQSSHSPSFVGLKIFNEQSTYTVRSKP